MHLGGREQHSPTCCLLLKGKALSRSIVVVAYDLFLTLCDVKKLKQEAKQKGLFIKRFNSLLDIRS